jgi:O-antigen/teichoic acid export membrane protein
LSRSTAHPGRSILFAYAGIAVPAAIAVVLIPLLLRNLGAARFGLLSLLMSVAAFFAGFDFGIGPALARFTSRYQSRSADTPRIRRLAMTGLLIQGGIGLVTGAIVFVALRFSGAASAVAAGVGVWEFNLAVAMVALATPLALQSGGARSVLEGTGHFGLANAVRASSSASTFAAPIAASFVSPRLDVMMGALFAARLATNLAFWRALTRVLPSKGSGASREYVIRVGRRLLTYGGWVMLGLAAGGVVVGGTLDRLVIDRLQGPSAIVAYSIPSDIVLRALLVPSAIASVLIPLLAAGVARATPLGPELRRASATISGPVGPLALVLVLLADWILELLARGYVGRASLDVLQAMAVGLYVGSVAHAPYAALQALGRPNHAAIRHVVELPFYAAGSFLLVRAARVDLLGVLWAAWTCVDIAILAWLVRSLRPEIRLGESGLSLRTALWVAALCSAVAATRLGLPRTAAIAVSAVALVYWLLGASRLALRHE